MKKNYTIFIILITFSFCHAQEIYYSNGENVNVREFPNQSSLVVGKLSKGQKIEVIETVNDWSKISYQNNEYYVATKFLTQNEDGKKDLGFKDGFLQTYLYSGLIFVFLLTAPEVMKRKVADRRFKEGYRQDKVPELTMWKNFLISAIVAIPIALIGGIICWIF